MPSKSSETPEYAPTPVPPLRSPTTSLVGHKCRICGYVRRLDKGHKGCPLSRFCPRCLHEVLVNGDVPVLEVIEEVVPVSENPLVKTKKVTGTDNIETVLMPRTSAKLKRKKK